MQKERIIDKHKKEITIDFSIVSENDSRIFYMQRLNEARKDVQYDDLNSFMKGTLVELFLKFHNIGTMDHMLLLCEIKFNY